MTGGIEEKYLTVRSRLDKFGYKAPLGIESIPLVERIFADLIHTTEALKKARLRNSHDSHNQTNSTVTTGKAVDDAVEPFRQDNSRLMMENNELHKSLVSMRQKINENKNDFKQQARRLQNENADLRFLNTQYLTKIKQTEKESFSKSEKIRKLQEKNLSTVISTPSGTKKLTQTRRQKITIDSTLPGSKFVAPPIPAPDDLFVADVLKMTEERCVQLENQLVMVKKAKGDSDERISHVRKQKELVESENDRLRRQLEGGRPKEAVTIEQATRASEKIISQLNLQLEISQESQREAEDHSARLMLEIEELKARNDKLKSEMNEIGQMATVLEQERIQAVEKADRASSELNVQGLTIKNRELEDQLEEALRSRYEIELKLADLEGKLEAPKLPENVEQIIKERDFYQNAYRKISQSNMVSDEHVTTEHVTELIRERDEMSSRLIQLENRLAEKNSNLKVVQQERDRVQLQSESMHDELAQIRREIINSNSPVKHQKPSQSTPESILRRIETERDSALRDLRRLTCERDSLLEQVKTNRERKICDAATLEQKVEDVENRARLLENERRDLLMQCSDYKTQLEVLNEEKHNFEIKIGELEIDNSHIKTEIDELRVARNQSEQIHNEDKRVHYVLRAEIESEKEKNQALESRVQILSLNSTEVTSELSRLRAALTAMDREKDALSMALDDKTERLAELEDSMKKQEVVIGESKFKISKLDQEIEILTEQIEDNDRQASHTRKLLDEKRSTEAELLAFREIAVKEKRELAKNVEILTNENFNLRKELEILVDQNQGSTNQVEEFTEKITGLESQLLSARHQLSEVSTQNHSLFEKCQNFENEVEQMSKIRELNDQERNTIAEERNAISDRAIQLESEIIQHIQATNEYENQITHLSSNLQKYEQVLEESRNENVMLNSALDGARSLNAQLQTSADMATRDITVHVNDSINKERLCEELRGDLVQIKNEQKEAKNQIYLLEATIRKLREDQFESEMNQVELKSERDLALEQAKNAQIQFENCDHELVQNRVKISDYDTELETLRRQITDLKFQNERLNQSVKRYSRDTDTM